MLALKVGVEQGAVEIVGKGFARHESAFLQPPVFAVHKDGGLAIFNVARYVHG